MPLLKRKQQQKENSLTYIQVTYKCEFFFFLGIQIVSERELAQLAQIRPLIFSFHEQSNIKDCFKLLEKKLAGYEILQEFMVNILVLKKSICDFPHYY